MTHEKYTPISCSSYDEYALAIMHRRPVALAWIDDSGVQRSSQVMPLDLRTREGEEFLVFSIPTEESPMQVRLDKILSMT